ncbi:hypothetical protein ElyMa_005049700 [Elysia marginata]|uniref:G-protein coupled receptors family 1 profile domain-containing protein n=1 Tax=Elysia marginata TaxID=1093978 RepID=A0AAV4JBF6_9GAST|nr:hypothetical protein ElyMa_005049700 [Elysia marginata]
MLSVAPWLCGRYSALGLRAPAFEDAYIKSLERAIQTYHLASFITQLWTVEKSRWYGREMRFNCLFSMCADVSSKQPPSTHVSTTSAPSNITPTAEDENFFPFHADTLFFSNLSLVVGLSNNETTHLPTEGQRSSLNIPNEDDERSSTTSCCAPELMKNIETQTEDLVDTLVMAAKAQGHSENFSVAMQLGDAKLENENNLLSPNVLYSKIGNDSLYPIDVNQTIRTTLNITEGSPTTNALSNNTTITNTTTTTTTTTASGNKNVRIWEKGIVKRELLDPFLTYFRCFMIIPVVMSVISVVLTVSVFRNKAFIYQGKPLVISFNIFEGLKVVAFLFFRLVKLFVGNSQITWNSWYAKFFVYYIMWLPIGLGRIGFLHNGLITLDRFFTVAFPLRRYGKRLVTQPKICIVVIVISMFTYQVAPMILFFREVQPILDYEKTFSKDEIISEIYVTNPEAFRVYMLVLTIGDALFVYIPLLLALIFNTLTIISLWRHEKAVRATLKDSTCSNASRALSKSQAVKRQTNNMIVVSSLIFAVLVLWRRLLPLAALFVKDFGEGRRETHLYILLNDIFILLDCVSPLVNIISYISLGSQFRRRLKEILVPAVPRNDRLSSSKSNTDSG